MNFQAHSLRQRASVPIAKHRLKSLLIADRIHCTTQQYEHLSNDLYETCAKYMKVDKNTFRISIEEKEIHILL